MSAPKDPAELALVTLALTCRVRGCCEWDEKAARVFRGQFPLPDLTLDEVRETLIEQVTNGKEVIQVTETRENWSHYPFYYKVILDIEDLPRGLFVELRLIDDDPDVPTVHIVSVHKQST
jgi:hypothetical protein